MIQTSSKQVLDGVLKDIACAHDALSQAIVDSSVGGGQGLVPKQRVQQVMKDLSRTHATLKQALS